MSAPLGYKSLDFDCLSVCFSFLSDRDLAVASSTHRSWHDEASKIAQKRLENQWNVISLPELALKNLALKWKVESRYSAAVVTAIGLSRLISSQYLETDWRSSDEQKRSAEFTTKDHRGPIASGRDAWGDPFISFHIRLKSDRNKIITYNTWTEASYYTYADMDDPLQRGPEGPLLGIGRSSTVGIGNEVCTEFGPFHHYYPCEVLNSRKEIARELDVFVWGNSCTRLNCFVFQGYNFETICV